MEKEKLTYYSLVKVSIKCYNKGKVVSYMTELQKTIINKVNRLSDNDIQILMLIIDRLLPANETKTCQLDQKLQAFNNLQASVNRIKNYLPSDYDPEGEYREAMELKFSSEAFYSQFA